MNNLGTEVMKQAQWEKSKIIGENISRLRKSLEITQENLASQLGISRRALCSYECGKASIPIALIPELAEILRTPIAMLLNVTPSMLDERTREAKLLRELEKINSLPEKDRKLIFNIIDSLVSKQTATTK